MALLNLLEGLKAEAAAETAQLEAETEAEADRIVEEARAEGRMFQEQAARVAESDLREEAERRRADARLESAAALREAREEEFQEYLDELRTQLNALRGQRDYRAVLRDLVRESLVALPGASTLRVDPRDKRLAHDLLAELEASLDVVDALDTAGGAELASDDGRTVRNTIEERFANAEPALRLLFGDMLAGIRSEQAREAEPTEMP